MGRWTTEAGVGLSEKVQRHQRLTEQHDADTTGEVLVRTGGREVPTSRRIPAPTTTAARTDAPITSERTLPRCIAVNHPLVVPSNPMSAVVIA